MVGASNVAAAYAYWSRLGHAPFRLLAYMANVSLDQPRNGQPARRYFGKPEDLCGALGYRPSDNAARNVRNALAALTKAGAIETVVKPAPDRKAEYALHLDGGTSGSYVQAANVGTSGSATQEPQMTDVGTSGSATQEPEVPPQEQQRSNRGRQEEDVVASATQVQTARETDEPTQTDLAKGEEPSAARATCDRCGTYLDRDGSCFGCRLDAGTA